MPGLHPPIQSRSRRTLERILDGTESLLGDRLFDALSITEILAAAGVSAGSFYARFESKDDVLPALLDRYERRRTAHFQGRLEPQHWRDLTLADAAHRVAELVADHYRDHRGLLRSFVMYYRTRPEAFTARHRRRLGGLYALLAERLLEHRREVLHEDPEAAVRAVITSVVAVARESILFGAPPDYSAMRLPHDRLVDWLAHLMLAALTSPPAEPRSTGAP